jgi:hypothetical protein
MSAENKIPQNGKVSKKLPCGSVSVRMIRVPLTSQTKTGREQRDSCASKHGVRNQVLNMSGNGQEHTYHVSRRQRIGRTLIRPESLQENYSAACGFSRQRGWISPR